jgi:hypothetical protein
LAATRSAAGRPPVRSSPYDRRLLDSQEVGRSSNGRAVDEDEPAGRGVVYCGPLFKGLDIAVDGGDWALETSPHFGSRLARARLAR